MSAARAEAHLARVCPGMKAHVKLHPRWALQPVAHDGPYEALARSIVFQQLSTKAAATIHKRFLALFAPPHPAPDAILAAEDTALRAAGLSRQKIAALRDLAQKRLDGIVPGGGEIEALPDDEIIARLTQVRGVGRWTVEMYLIFTLARPDVLPVDDLGVRKGAEIIVGRAFKPRDLAAYGARWAPFRSAAAWHCWRAVHRARGDEPPFP